MRYLLAGFLFVGFCFWMYEFWLYTLANTPEMTDEQREDRQW